MEWRFWNIFLIYPTISRTRDMSLGNFFECRRCLYGWAKGNGKPLPSSFAYNSTKLVGKRKKETVSLTLSEKSI